MQVTDFSTKIHFFETLTDGTKRRRFADGAWRDSYLLCSPLQSGRVRLRRGNKVVFNGEIRPGMLAFAGADEPTDTVSASALRVATFCLPSELARSLLPSTASSDLDALEARGLHVLPDPEVAHLVARVAYARHYEPAHRQLLIDGAAYLLLANLLHPSSNGLSAARPKVSGLTRAELERCAAYADARLDTPFRVAEWAAALGLPAVEFARRFKATTRRPPHAWLLERRLDRAKDLLLASSLSLTEIALHVGFSSQSHFTDAFRQRVGIAPGRWRSCQRT